MKRITINKNDEPASVVEKIIDLPDEEIVLVIPRFARFTESLGNFHLVKREAEVLKKRIIIESVDDKAVELAAASGLDSLNPFFQSARRRMSDIVLPESSASRSRKDKNISSASDKVRAPDPAPIVEDSLLPKKRRGFSFKLPTLPRFKLPTIKMPAMKNKLVYWIGGIILVIVSVVAIVKFLPKADIIIVAEKMNWSYTDSVTVDKNLSLADISGETIKLPGQLFVDTQNLSLTFPANGKKQVEQKARGTIMIYNAFSSASQPLVINTRFETPDGKIFRLTKAITVAGAQVVGGQITPSVTEATVAADRAGTEYNIGPVDKFTIPGFKGTPRFDAFYAKSVDPMTGGYIGEAAYPTNDDINQAKSAAAQQLEDALKTTLVAQIPPEFKILDGAVQFKLMKQEVETQTDANKNFSVFTEGELRVLAFKEQSLKEALFAKGAKETNENFVNQNHQLTYTGTATADSAVNQINFAVDFSGVFWPRIDIEELKRDVAGKSEDELRAMILSLPDIESAKVALWPFWVGTVPMSTGKINVTIE